MLHRDQRNRFECRSRMAEEVDKDSLPTCVLVSQYGEMTSTLEKIDHQIASTLLGYQDMSRMATELQEPLMKVWVIQVACDDSQREAEVTENRHGHFPVPVMPAKRTHGSAGAQRLNGQVAIAKPHDVGTIGQSQLAGQLNDLSDQSKQMHPHSQEDRISVAICQFLTKCTGKILSSDLVSGQSTRQHMQEHETQPAGDCGRLARRK